MNGADFKPSVEAISAQCTTVLAELVKGPQTTAALHALGVLAPAARILNLRRAGHRISTLRSGRQAQYVMAPADEGQAP